ncbi:MAG: thioredoxin fold domain-containing protein [Epsilonproteobacteria bacterium]|nr:thioredoxin fold domain-containing protein [Campylobacterota bacterium]
MRYILILYFFTISLFGFNYHLKPYHVTDGVECFLGLPLTVEKINGGNVINTCYVETSEGFVVIDSGPTYSYAQQAYNVMQDISKMPVKYVINTSSDELHILGNEFYKEMGAILIGPKDYKKIKKVLLKEKITDDAFINTRLIPLDKIVTKNYNVTVGNTKVRVEKIINDDRFLTVYIPQRKIFFAGDMLYNNRIPELKGHYLLNWLKALKKIEAIKWTTIVGSYGIVMNYSALKNTTSYLTLLKKEITSNIKKGMSKKQCIKNVTMSAFKGDRFYDLLHKKNVAIAYDELKSKIKNKKKTEHKKEKLIKKKIKSKKKHKREKKKKIKIEKKIKKEKIKKKKTKSEKRTKKEKVAKKENKKITPIYYHSFPAAIRMARQSKKIVLIKIRSDNCPYCDELEKILKQNSRVKEIINENYKMVQLNMSRDNIPLGIRVSATPTLVFVRPDIKKVVMVIPGIDSSRELISILKEGIKYGKQNGYLK